MPESKERYNVAILGLGTRALTLADTFRESLGDRIRVAAVADPAVESAKKRLESFDLQAAVYATPEDLLAAEKEIDGVLICTPNNCHLESFLAVKHLRKPILLEKPVEGDVDNFRRFAPELMRYEAPVLVSHCMRHAPILKRAKELIEQGVIGDVTSMRFIQNCEYGANFFSCWRRRKEVVTSLYMEKATHDFDIMHMLNGEHHARTIFALSKRYKFGGDKPNDLVCDNCDEEVACNESGLNREVLIRGGRITQMRQKWSGLNTGRGKCVWAKEIDIGDDEMCLIEFANGVQATYVQTFYTPRSYKGNVYTVVGKEGVVEIDLGHSSNGKIEVYHRYGTRHDRTVHEFDYFGRTHYNGDTFLVRNFLGVMQGTEEPLTTAEAAIAAENTGIAAVRSVESRRLEDVEQVSDA
jgi:predicted dehydrogenase